MCSKLTSPQACARSDPFVTYAPSAAAARLAQTKTRHGASTPYRFAVVTRGQEPLQVQSLSTFLEFSLHPIFAELLNPLDSGARYTPITCSGACNDDAGHQRHAGSNSLPQLLCSVSMFASAAVTLLGPVSLWVRYMYAIANTLPCSQKSSNRNYYIISPGVMFNAIIIIYKYMYTYTCKYILVHIYI